jgi:uncharacterized membrane protein
MNNPERCSMDLREYKAFFLIVTAVFALLAASPAIQRFLVLPQTEFFTEMWLLGPEHAAENYPFNITRNTNYDVFLDVANHLGHVAYYLIQVKFRNQTQSAADSFNRTASSLPSLCNITCFVGDKESWELPVVFSFDYEYNDNLSQVTFSRLILNNNVLSINEYSAVWDPQKNGFFGNLFFELWLYNDTSNAFQYHERSVSLWCNMTI